MIHQRRSFSAALLAAATLIPHATLAAAQHAETMVVAFTIQDYAAWRPVFDAANAERVKAGVTNPRIFRDADHPDRMLVLFSVASHKQGRAWMTSADVKTAWHNGGVVGVPTYHFMR
jgi:hypothetical protein